MHQSTMAWYTFSYIFSYSCCSYVAHPPVYNLLFWKLAWLFDKSIFLHHVWWSLGDILCQGFCTSFAHGCGCLVLWVLPLELMHFFLFLEYSVPLINELIYKVKRFFWLSDKTLIHCNTMHMVKKHSRLLNIFKGRIRVIVSKMNMLVMIKCFQYT